MKINDRKKVYSAAILYSCIIGFSFLAVKTSLRETATPILLSHRFAIAFLGVLIVMRVRKIPVRISVREFFLILPLAVFYPVLYFWLQSVGLEITPSSIAGILQSTTPVFSVILAAIILQEKTAGHQLLGIMLTILGVGVLSLQNQGPASGGADLKGYVILILSAAAFGCYSVFSRKLSRELPAFILTFWMLLVGFIWFNLYSLFTMAGPERLSQFITPLKHPGYLTAILYLGVLSSLASSYLSNYVLARMEAAKMNVFGSLATVISVMAGIIFLHEPCSMLLVVGLCIIVIGVVLVNTGKISNGS